MYHHMTVDIETYSSVDIKKAGLYKYVESPDFEVLLFAYSIDGAPVQVCDLASGEVLPNSARTALLSRSYIKHAYNAAFEWYCLSKYLNASKYEWLSQWRCSMVHAMYLGYPSSLRAVGEAIGLPQDKRKLGIGKSLINLFCKPVKATKSNGMRTRILPHHEPEKWRLFKEYNAQDVVTEMEIDKRLARYPLPVSEQILWKLDMQINSFGVHIDTDLMNGALSIAAETTDALLAEAKQISMLENPKSVSQLKKWLETETEEEIENLNKDTVRDLVSKGISQDHVLRMLQIRQELGKTSCKKYDAMSTALCADNRVRGLLQFYGANRTGRWAGRLVQVQNLPRNYLQPIDLARALVKSHKTAMLRFVYGSIPDTLSQLIRTTFIPSPGCKFVVADFSAIEARVISWLAGETWRQEVFATHGKIYEASAASMFGVPIERIKKGNPEYALRQKGKVAELALGYQGGTHALIQMGALKGGLTEEELPDIVRRWRAANPRIVDLWYKIESAAIDTIKTGRQNGVNGLLFSFTGDLLTGQTFLTVSLPSGRQLFYNSPSIGVNRFGKDSINYIGMNQSTRKWGQQETYGGKLVENIVQAIARDCLAVAMTRLHAAGYQIVMHIHDEVVIDCPEECVDLYRACEIMGKPINWAPGLLLRADGFMSDYYKKD